MNIQDYHFNYNVNSNFNWTSSQEENLSPYPQQTALNQTTFEITAPSLYTPSQHPSYYYEPEDSSIQHTQQAALQNCYAVPYTLSQYPSYYYEPEGSTIQHSQQTAWQNCYPEQPSTQPNQALYQDNVNLASIDPIFIECAQEAASRALSYLDHPPLTAPIQQPGSSALEEQMPQNPATLIRVPLSKQSLRLKGKKMQNHFILQRNSGCAWWSLEEQDLLKKAKEMYGNDWEKISQSVGRSVAKCKVQLAMIRHREIRENFNEIVFSIHKSPEPAQPEFLSQASAQTTTQTLNTVTTPASQINSSEAPEQNTAPSKSKRVWKRTKEREGQSHFKIKLPRGGYKKRLLNQPELNSNF